MGFHLQSDWNIVLIGMPGAGKSTVGVLLAKHTARDFLDTDLLIQSSTGRRLQAIIDADGLDEFCRIEQQSILDLTCRRSVIATGGSVVYSEAAMGHLRSHGLIVHLDVPLGTLEQRLGDAATRGMVIAKGMTLADLYQQRRPLYERWADFHVDCAGAGQDEVVRRVLDALNRSEV